MKHTITYTLGYVGYFLIAYTGLRLMFFHEDKVGFVIITAALLLSQGYSTYLEKQIGTPLYGTYIKSVIILIFLLASFTLFL